MKKWSYDSETLAMAYLHHITQYMCCDKKFIFFAIKTRQVNTVHQLHSTDLKSYGISVPIFVLLSILILGHLIYQRALLQQWKLLNIASFYNKSSFE